jgi:2,5-diketo-D-gluconate reductase A
VTSPVLQMNDGREVPQLGFGVFQIPPGQTAPAVSTALAEGYRLIDTAQGYGNEAGVGEAIAQSGLARAELFVTTKLTNSEHGTDRAQRAFDDSLRRLGMDYVDLFLIHWPVPGRDLYVETWRALEKIHRDGRARSIGVSNFTVEHLRRLARETETVPAVNQVELHPWFPQPELRQYHQEHGILTEAWGPLGQGTGLLDDDVITQLAAEKSTTPAQIVLRWHVQIGNIVIPKSTTPERIRANIDVFGFALSDADMRRLDGLANDGRIGPDPATFNQM